MTVVYVVCAVYVTISRQRYLTADKVKRLGWGFLDDLTAIRLKQ